MNIRSTDVKVGIAVIVAAVILILGVAWIGQFRVNRHWVPYTVYFPEVGGLSPGSAVTVVGLEMGKVGPIRLEGGRVRVELLLDHRVTLRQDCSIEVRSVGLMEEKFVYVTPGTAGEKIQPGSVIDGKYTPGLADLTPKLEAVMDEIKGLSQSARELMGAAGAGTNLAQSLEKVDEVSAEILAMLRENRDDLRSAAKNVRSASENLNSVLGAKKGDIADGLTRFAQAAARLDSLTTSLQSVAGSLEEGQGTLGMLIKDKKVHEDIEKTLATLNALLADIKEHPERYINVRIF